MARFRFMALDIMICICTHNLRIYTFTQIIASEHHCIFSMNLFRILPTLNVVMLHLKHQNSYPYDIRHYHTEMHTNGVLQDSAVLSG